MSAEPVLFVCDAALGGLARWLRAAGHSAHAIADAPPEAALREAQRLGATLLTGDRRALERRVVRGGELRALVVPTTVAPDAQLAFVLRACGLDLRAPRCMACGGELRAAAKDTVRARIPPRTALWKDEYWVCAGCDRLFWQGTHWERIEARLRAASR
jgi:hypothetical protein